MAPGGVSRRLFVPMLVGVLSALAWAGTVSADIALLEVEPARDSTVQAGPLDIIATFDHELQEGSFLRLHDAADEIVARAAVDGATMRIGLEGILPGAYTVRWRAVPPDGHFLVGNWTFTVAAPSPTPPPSAEPSPTPRATATPVPSPSASPTATPSPPLQPASPDTVGTDVTLPVVAGVAALVAALGTFLLRRGRPG